MYAVIRSGGKQERVEEGQRLQVERLTQGDGEELSFAPVLVVDGDTVLAAPGDLAGASVSARVVGQAKGPQVRLTGGPRSRVRPPAAWGASSGRGRARSLPSRACPSSRTRPSSTSRGATAARAPSASAVRPTSPAAAPTAATAAPAATCGWWPTGTWPRCWPSGTTPIAGPRRADTARGRAGTEPGGPTRG